MALTWSRTASKTFTRLGLIKLQIDRALTRSRIDADYISRLLKGIDKKWITDVMLYALDRQGECWAELHMKIDWDRNELHVKTGRNNVVIDSRWRDDVAIEVDKTMTLFEEYCAGRDFEIVCYMRYASGVDRVHAHSVLGFVDTPDVTWAGPLAGTEMTIPEIDEFTIGINLVDPE